ncbi:MAG: class I SAM-dependent methyltransferase [Bryobacteraceae bacterium]|nr:class I SAM-dependent methyltransferase [Bryobacteraceae bacterium]
MANLNRVCNVEDWQKPELVSMMKTLLPYFSVDPKYPTGSEHRKHWEYAHVVNGLHELGAVHPESWILSVAGGHEEPAFYLTNHIRWMFLCDLYGISSFSDAEAQTSVLLNPDAFATLPYNRKRLVVQIMNALDLRYEDGTFNGVFCMSSIEHFGGFDGARNALAEMGRVTKPGGIVAITTECIVNNKPDLDLPGLYLFSPATIDRLCSAVPGLVAVEPVEYRVSKKSMEASYDLHQAVADAKNNYSRYPHTLLELEGRLFTSVAVFLRKSL